MENLEYRKAVYEGHEELESRKQGRFLIVVIGINQYQHWQKLKNAVQDAMGFQQVMIDKFGFTPVIEPLTDEKATKKAITSLVEDQLRTALKEDDNLILFFVGHGHNRVDRVGTTKLETAYLIPVEATSSDNYSDCIEIGSFLKSVAKLPAKHILVILDSCKSGFALGESTQNFRNTKRYEHDLNSRVSRRVITSAMKNQDALDNGPIPGHSLFTGTLINGFSLGEADMDQNGLITSSELGLFLQQKVAQASNSQQTPDFGSFYLDDRGEMVIPLRYQSFDSIKIRAFSALQKGEFIEFRELVGKLKTINFLEPKTLYFCYRLALIENNLEEIKTTIKQLYDIGDQASKIPLSRKELLYILNRVELIDKLITLPDIDSPLDISVMAGKTEENLQIVKAQIIDNKQIYFVPYEYLIKFKITNPSPIRLFIYMLKINSSGFIEISGFWEDDKNNLNGLQPDETGFSYTFNQEEIDGICERRFISSPQGIQSLSYPPSPNVPVSAVSRYTNAKQYITKHLGTVRMKAIRYRPPLM